MDDNTRDKILFRIKQALEKKTSLPFENVQTNLKSTFQPSTQELEIEFAKNFSEISGKFSFCENEKQLAEQLNALAAAKKWTKIFCREPELKYTLSINGFKNFEYPDLNTCQSSITYCEFLIARTGSILLSSQQKSGRNTSVFAPVHICIAYTKQLVYDIGDALYLLQEKYNNNLPSLITLASGPSRTADIEKTLVTGVHGPKEVFLFLVDE